MIDLIAQTINKIDDLIKEQLPESKYQFELYDLTTNTKHFRGYDEPFHWGSVYKLFVVAEIVKMSQEGLFAMDDEIQLHKERYTHGSGVLKFMTHLNKLTYIDACKLLIATSDNLCADELHEIVSTKRLNNLFGVSNCNSSHIQQNLDSLVKELFEGIANDTLATYVYSEDFKFHFNNKLKDVLSKNYTSVSDENQCLHYIFSEYLKNEHLAMFTQCVLTPNIHSRLAYYTHFGKYLLRGKSGMLGLGLVNNETVAIFKKYPSKIVGYFSINTKDNNKRYFQANDTFGLIGIEIVKLYEQLGKQAE
ncbi:MAG: serine hydrolase [Chitinophagales bacterium]